MERESRLKPTQEIRKVMHCRTVERSIRELEKEGWECAWSFHTRFPEQWDDACDLVEKIKAGGVWEVVLVLGQDEAERRDGVAYLYKKRIGT